jgi:polyhydroxyalkanoate synthase
MVWLAKADEHPGSWSPDWFAWLTSHDGSTADPARAPGGGKLQPIEDAPDSYVKVKG